MTVVKLVVSNDRPACHACADCKFFLPDTESFGWQRKWLFKRVRPSANAMRFGICTAFGGGFAKVEREFNCRNGDAFQPAKENER